VTLATRIYLTGGIRSFTTGAVGVLLGLYLARLNVAPGAVGLIVGAGLAGGAVATMVVAMAAERLGRRRVLMIVTALGGAGLGAAALAASPVVLGLAAFFGMVNGMGRDRGAAQTLEQSVLADEVTDGVRTGVFSRYALIQDLAGALGALASAVPAGLEWLGGLAGVPAYRATFLALAIVSLLPVAIYAGLGSFGLPTGTGATNGRLRVPLGAASRRRVRALAGLFALDSVGGGFLAGSILSYWFFRQFGLSGQALGLVFFAARGLNAASYLVAERLAGRIGLVRTMVFTHLPSSAILLALPFVGNAWLAILLFLLRESLVQMDVPTRQSYVAAVTGPGERTFALGVTGVVRNAGWAVGPPLAGQAMAAWGLGAPLVLGAVTKIVYDLALYGAFRRIRPPEEQNGAARAA